MIFHHIGTECILEVVGMNVHTCLPSDIKTTAERNGSSRYLKSDFAFLSKTKTALYEAHLI